jgi:diacylglycerol kinase (ATP)
MYASIAIDDQVFEGEFVMIMISNCRRYAGGEYVLNPDAILDDGLFEVRMFAGSRKRDVFSFLIDLVRGKILDNSNIRVAKGTRIRVSTRTPAPVHRDGDPAGFTPVDCHVEPASLKILVPNTASASLFLQPGTPFHG